MSDNGGELGSFLAGFVIGGLVGAATALILAPQSGQATRSQLANRSSGLRQAGEERLQHVREAAGGSLASTRDLMQEVGGQVQERARIVLDTGKAREDEPPDMAEMPASEDKPAADGEGAQVA